MVFRTASEMVGFMRWRKFDGVDVMESGYLETARSSSAEDDERSRFFFLTVVKSYGKLKVLNFYNNSVKFEQSF